MFNGLRVLASDLVKAALKTTFGHPFLLASYIGLLEAKWSKV